jgi:hypothetical protein
MLRFITSLAFLISAQIAWARRAQNLKAGFLGGSNLRRWSNLSGWKTRPLASTTWTCHPALNNPRALATVSTGLVKSVRVLSPSFEACTTSAAIGFPAGNRKAAIGVRSDDGLILTPVRKLRLSEFS